jgi:hypothetical protein
MLMSIVKLVTKKNEGQNVNNAATVKGFIVVFVSQQQLHIHFGQAQKNPVLLTGLFLEKNLFLLFS